VDSRQYRVDRSVREVDWGDSAPGRSGSTGVVLVLGSRVAPVSWRRLDGAERAGVPNSSAEERTVDET
jgi:hypothetical protein